MTHFTHALVLLTSATLALGACGKSEDKDSASSDNKAASASKGADKPAPKALKAAPIASMKVQIDVPEDADVNDNTETAHFPSATIYASPTIFITGANEMIWDAELSKVKTDLEKQPGNTFKKYLKEEAAEGGFHLEYELSSMMDPKKTLYGFHIRTTIGETQYDCSSNTQSTEEMAKGVSMCKSLRAL